jgi:hypothetical protein
MRDSNKIPSNNNRKQIRDRKDNNCGFHFLNCVLRLIGLQLLINLIIKAGIGG